MSNFWQNINKFPRFIITVIMGFFLTTFYPIFELLKEKKSRIITIIIVYTCITIIYQILKLMLGLN